MSVTTHTAREPRFVFYDVYNIFSGAQISMCILVNELCRRGYSVEVITGKGTRMDIALAKGVHRRYLPLALLRWERPRLVKLVLDCVFIMMTYALSQRSTIFVANDELCASAFIPLRLLYKKIVWHVRSSARIRYLDGILLAGSSRVLVMNRSMARAKFGFASHPKIRCVGTAYDPDIAKESQLEVPKEFEFLENRTVISVIGAIVPGKRIIDAIKAFAGIKHDDTVLLIVGPKVSRYHSYYEEVRHYILSQGLSDSVLLVENYDKAYWVYKVTQVLLVTSEYEGIPRVILEALYFDLPVVTSDVGGIREALSDDAASIIVRFCPVADIGSFTGALEEVLASKCVGGRNFVAKEFSVEQHVDNVLRSIGGLTTTLHASTTSSEWEDRA